MSKQVEAVEKILCALGRGDIKRAEKIIADEYPFKPFVRLRGVTQ